MNLVNVMPTRPINLPPVTRIVGVDFSGAAEAGKTAWMAELTRPDNGSGRMRLETLSRLGRLAGDDRRAHVYSYLVDRIRESEQTGWGFDFPFGLPIELQLGDWHEQLEHVAEHSGDARDYGHFLVETSQRVGGKMHIRRVTDSETQTPFDCYHYRIIYQTFHGMRDVLMPLSGDVGTAVLPFQYDRVSQASRLVMEACPASTLKRLALPHRLYKQTGNKPPSHTHRKTRREILRRLTDEIEISDYRRRVIMNDPGGDALDAVIAALGTAHSIDHDPHDAIAAHDRYPREGRVYC